MKNINLLYLLIIVFIISSCSKSIETFIQSIEENDLEAVKSHIEAKIDVNSPSEKGMLLSIAAQKADKDIITALIKAGANKDALDANGNTALIHACKTNKLENVSALLKNKANPYIQNLEKQSALSLSKENDKLKSIIESELLLDQKLIKTIEKGQVTQIDSLISLGANINAFDVHHSTPLIIAAWYGRSKIVQLLLDKGANTEMQISTGETALEYAKKSYKEHLKDFEYNYNDLGINLNNVETIIGDEVLFNKKLKELDRNMGNKQKKLHGAMKSLSSFTCFFALLKLKGVKDVIGLLEKQ